MFQAFWRMGWQTVAATARLVEEKRVAHGCAMDYHSTESISIWGYHPVLNPSVRSIKGRLKVSLAQVFSKLRQVVAWENDEKRINPWVFGAPHLQTTPTQ